MEESLDQIRALVRDGKKIEAIKLLRERYGLDLTQAKAEIDRISLDPDGVFTLEAMRAPSVTSGSSVQVSREVEELARRGNKIGAIKLHREQTGLGLKEAKEQLEKALGPIAGGGCMSVFILVTVLLTAAYGLFLS